MIQARINECTPNITSFDMNKLITTSRIFSKIKLSPSAKLVLRCLIDFRNHKSGLAFPKQSTISETTGLTKASVNKAVEELRREKLILTIKYNGKLNYQFTNVLFGLLKQPDDKDLINSTKGKTKYTGENIKNITSNINKIDKKIKNKEDNSFKEASLSGIESTKAWLKQQEKEKLSSTSPFDDFNCAVQTMKGILDENVTQNPVGKLILTKIKTIWNLDDDFIEKLMEKKNEKTIEH